MNRSTVVFYFLMFAVLFSVACSKPILRGQIQETLPLIQVIDDEPAKVSKATQRALEYHGYIIRSQGKDFLETTWQPTTADSHYIEVFGRQDRGVVGAYHKIAVKISPVSSKNSSKTRVKVTSISKSIVSNLKSTKIEEKKIIDKIQDFARPQNIDVTNIGLVKAK